MSLSSHQNKHPPPNKSSPPPPSFQPPQPNSPHTTQRYNTPPPTVVGHRELGRQSEGSSFRSKCRQSVPSPQSDDNKSSPLSPHFSSVSNSISRSRSR